jgi:mannosyltransferase OCH1-like enzyme
MIHQIFINLGKGELCDIPDYYESYKETLEYCEKNKIKHILWSSEDIDDLLNDYPEYKQIYSDFRYDIQRIDFARLLILYHHGGLYLDLDVKPLPEAGLGICFEKDFFIARWWNNHLPYNAIIACHKKSELMYECIKEVIRSYYEKSKMDIYNVRKARFIFQTTGHYALHRVLKNKITYSPVVSVFNNKKKINEMSETALFTDKSCSVWYEGF